MSRRRSVGVRGSATVISQVICQTCWGTAFPQAGLWTPRSSRARRRYIYAAWCWWQPFGDKSSVETITVLELSWVAMQYCSCLVVGNWTRSDMTTLQNNILLNVKLPGTLISLLSLELSDQVMWAVLDSDGDFTFHRWFVTARSSACPRKIITLSPFQVPNALLWSVSVYFRTSALASQILILSKELRGVARSSLALLSRIHAATEQKILHNKVVWVIVFGISRISLVFLQVSLLLSYSFLRLASSPPQGVPPSREVESSY